MCHCSQQKTRCEPATQGLGSAPAVKCSRCARLNLVCSFEQSPPHGKPTSEGEQTAPELKSRTPVPPRLLSDQGGGLHSGIPRRASTNIGTSSSTAQSYYSSPTSQTNPRAQPIPLLTPVSPSRSHINLGEPTSALDLATTTNISSSPNKASMASKVCRFCLSIAAPAQCSRDVLNCGTRLLAMGGTFIVYSRTNRRNYWERFR